MSDTEKNKRLNELGARKIALVNHLIVQGYGERGIHLETGIPIRLIRAVFAR